MWTFTWIVTSLDQMSMRFQNARAGKKKKTSDCPKPRSCQAKATGREEIRKQNKTISSAFCKWSVGLVSFSYFL